MTSDSNPLPAVSIIIPTLREVENIGGLLAALERQDYEGALEIIVVDGGSDDGTQNIAKRYESVIVLESERGVSRQRNMGARHATGELLIFMDADTLPTSRFVRLVVAAYRRFPFAAACPWFVAREKQLSIRASYFSFSLLFWLGQSWLRMGSGVSIVTPRAVFEKVGGFDTTLHLGEDIHYLRRASRYGLHRQLLVPLYTSGRRFEERGTWGLLQFYARITPLLIFGFWGRLRRVPYEAAPYRKKDV